jgi:hypothetical protein
MACTSTPSFVENLVRISTCQNMLALALAVIINCYTECRYSVSFYAECDGVCWESMLKGRINTVDLLALTGSDYLHL